MRRDGGHLRELAIRQHRLLVAAADVLAAEGVQPPAPLPAELLAGTAEDATPQELLHIVTLGYEHATRDNQLLFVVLSKLPKASKLYAAVHGECFGC
jgi:hypothetical protein